MEKSAMEVWEWVFSLCEDGSYSFDQNRSHLPPAEKRVDLKSLNKAERMPSDSEFVGEWVWGLVDLLAVELKQPKTARAMQSRAAASVRCSLRLERPPPLRWRKQLPSWFRFHVTEGSVEGRQKVDAGEFAFSLLAEDGELCDSGPVPVEMDEGRDGSEAPLDSAIETRARVRVEVALADLKTQIDPLREEIIRTAESVIRRLDVLKVATVEEGRDIATKINELLSSLGVRFRFSDGTPAFLAYVVASGKRGGSDGFYLRAFGHAAESLSSGFGQVTLVEAPPDRRRSPPKPASKTR